MQSLQSAVGVFALLAIAWLLSENRRAVVLKQATIGLLVTFLTAVILLKIPGVSHAFAAVNDAINAIAAASKAGTSFVFGYLGGGQLPFELKVPGAEFVLALQALPIVLVMSVLTTLLFYWGILPPIVRGFAVLLERTLKVGGAVGLSTAANIFLGMVEAPLFIRPYIASLTRSELFMVMTGGMAGVAGTVLVLYATLLGPIIPDAPAHLVIASVIGAPAAILVSLIMVPEETGRQTGGKLAEVGPVASSTMDAIVKGTATGLELLLNICAMIIVLLALVAQPGRLIGAVEIEDLGIEKWLADSDLVSRDPIGERGQHLCTRQDVRQHVARLECAGPIARLRFSGGTLPQITRHRFCLSHSGRCSARSKIHTAIHGSW